MKIEYYSLYLKSENDQNSFTLALKRFLFLDNEMSRSLIEGNKPVTIAMKIITSIRIRDVNRCNRESTWPMQYLPIGWSNLDVKHKSTWVIGSEIINRIKRDLKVGQQLIICKINCGSASLLKGSIVKKRTTLPFLTRLQGVCKKPGKQAEINHR